MSRVGLYGGSFDPIHRGHLAPVRAAVEQLGLERVLYLPTARPPHKPESRFAPAARRFAMVELALLDQRILHAADLELGPEPVYTIDTVERVRRGEPDAEPFLLIGSDSLARIETWRRWEDLVSTVPLVVLRRPGWSTDEVAQALSAAGAERLRAAAVTWVDHEPVDVSATEIRRRLAAGEPLPASWLPAAVLKYIEKYGLYS